MPKYYDFKVADYYLYFTSFCVVECMHLHASDKKLTEGGSAKFFVKVTSIRSYRVVVSLMIAKLPRFQSLSKIIIRRCIFAGLNIATKAITRNNPSIFLTKSKKTRVCQNKSRPRFFYSEAPTFLRRGFVSCPKVFVPLGKV